MIGTDRDWDAHGIHNINVLADGLEAWKGLGLPLTEQFADVEAEVARLGMEVRPGSPFPLESSKHRFDAEFFQVTAARLQRGNTAPGLVC